MGYVLKAVLSSAQHPEYGQITVPFPIPDEKYCLLYTSPSPRDS